ncbi:hypothetical protein SAMN05421677_12314 [Halobacillus aidingensis]|uniref:Uncharacterized protein n=1 Tax=Halobacillus aidingensis TaxID=240303 RepID=A0A1H0TVS7_HALAD|nr:hypothetical protein SAMN05421677_12314 [Halobacillus aidingensis]
MVCGPSLGSVGEGDENGGALNVTVILSLIGLL